METVYNDVPDMSVDCFLRVWFEFFVDVRDNGAKEALIEKDLSSKWCFFTCPCEFFKGVVGCDVMSQKLADDEELGNSVVRSHVKPECRGVKSK